jgi:hypothetical protein
MTSPTDITEKRRAAKKAACGQARKKKIAKTGSTPVLFALNKPTAGETKKVAAKPAAKPAAKKAAPKAAKPAATKTAAKKK